MKYGTRIFAIDPGSEQSGWVIYEHGDPGRVIESGIRENRELMQMIYLRAHSFDGAFPCRAVIEDMTPYRVRTPPEVFQTCCWSGRFAEHWRREFGPIHDPPFISRKTVAAHLCGTARANNADIRGALYARFGGSRQKAVGKKKAPGPLHCVTSHAMQALALALTWAETH